MESNIQSAAVVDRPAIVWSIMPRIMAAAAAVTQVPVEFVTNNNRDRRAAYARHLAMYIARYEYGMSLATIAWRIGMKDHTTVLHGLQKINGYLITDPQCFLHLHRVREIMAGRMAEPKRVPMDEAWGPRIRNRSKKSATMRKSRAKVSGKPPSVIQPPIAQGVDPEVAIRMANDQLCERLRMFHPHMEVVKFSTRVGA